MVILAAQRQQQFKIPKSIAEKSLTLRNMMDDFPDTNDEDVVIPLNNVHGAVLKLIIDFCTHHASDDLTKPGPEQMERVKEWDREWLKSPEMDDNAIMSILIASNFLDIKYLSDLCCLKLSDSIKGLSPFSIREKYHIDELEDEEKMSAAAIAAEAKAQATTGPSKPSNKRKQAPTDHHANLENDKEDGCAAAAAAAANSGPGNGTTNSNSTNGTATAAASAPAAKKAKISKTAKENKNSGKADANANAHTNGNAMTSATAKHESEVRAGAGSEEDVCGA